MSVHDDLLAAVTYIGTRTGDSNAWQTGLTPTEVAAVANPATGPDQLSAILSKIRSQHPDLFVAQAPGAPPAAPPPQAPADRAQGDAAEAIARAEAALAQQNSTSSQLDMQVIAAILNAHLKTVEGREALDKLQRETEVAVQTRSDLDTPAGARDFQRFLIGKLRDIRALVLNASLDDTSKSALMAAWTSLYAASRDQSEPGGQPPAPAAPSDAAASDDPDTDWDPSLDALADDPGPAVGDSPTQGPTQATAAPALPTPQVMPTGFGSGPIPSMSSAPGSMPGLSLPLPALQDGISDAPRHQPNDEGPAMPQDRDPVRRNWDEPGPPDADPAEQPAREASSAAAPTTVTLPDGETVTAANPKLAAAIKAAVGGVPIADAFRQQGITIPPPGTAVTEPIDPLRLTPGDLGMFTDRHALALSPGKALLDGQIQHIATVSGPSFLGWEHPPAVTATAAAPGKPDTPTPTRPASAPNGPQ